MPNPLSKLLSRLSVGRKLLLIYLLDLSAVIFISGILIHEKFIAIDFARKELAGNAYILALRQPLIAAADEEAGRTANRAGSVLAGMVRETEARYGRGMESAMLSEAFASSLEAAPEHRTEAKRRSPSTPLSTGRELVTRVGNQSNLILDPDLDSYYTMSLVLLRFPELLETSRDITTQMQAFVATGTPMTTETATRYFILEGRLDAVSKGIESDFGEAFTGSADTMLQAALEPQRVRLLANIETFRAAARAMLEPGAGAPELANVLATDDELLRQLDHVWLRSGTELERLVQTRIDGFFHRMWLHLGTALSLLCMILVAVFTVARHIAVPLRRLSGVAEKVGRDGDDGVRVSWNSSDEIGRLVAGFNDMLDQLAVVRSSEKELAASARAAIAQRELVEAVPIPMVVTAIPTHEVLHANGPAQAWLGGRTIDPWAEGLDPTTRSRFFQRLADQDVVDEYEVRWFGGATPTWAVLSARRLIYQGQQAVVTAFTPINRMKMLEQRLGLWAKVFEASSETIMIVDTDHRIVSVNRAFSRSTAHDMRAIVGESPDLLLEEYGAKAFADLFAVAEVRGAWQGEVTIRRRDRTTFPAWMVISAVRDGGGETTHYICASLDISERKASEVRIRFLAQHDSLTALPNRSLCIERLREATEQAKHTGEKIAVLFIDLDHFKTINDSLGHHVGDGLLRSVAIRLLDAVRAGDTVSRLGGDEFIVILRGVTGRDDVLESVEHRLVPSIRKPHRVGEAELQVSCSVGIALFPDDASDIDELLRHADVAMYQAKTTGRDSARLFTTDLDDRARRKLGLQSQLRHALERSELYLHYQPKVRSIDRTVVGVEALLRWDSNELGSVSPLDFIAIAEESRLIMPIGAWVVNEALRQHAQWKAEGHGEIPVSINVSAVQLRNAGLVETFREALALHDVAPAMIELELTESTLMDGLDATLSQLRALKKLGITVSVDDFGTGFSSLTYLTRFPVDRIKIDRSFIRNLLGDPKDLAITRAIIGLGHSLGLTIIAEGVETEDVAAALREARCDELQGNFFAEALNPGEFIEWYGQARQPAVDGPRLKLVASDRKPA